MFVRTICFSSIVLCVMAADAMAAGDGKANEAEARYQTERANCGRKSVAEERAACLREAAAARGEALQGQLNDPDNQYERNALARCDALPASEQDLCRRRTRGEGEVKGSVSEGGIYREYKEITLPDSVAPDDARQSGQNGR